MSKRLFLLVIPLFAFANVAWAYQHTCYGRDCQPRWQTQQQARSYQVAHQSNYHRTYTRHRQVRHQRVNYDRDYYYRQQSNYYRGSNYHRYREPTYRQGRYRSNGVVYHNGRVYRNGNVRYQRATHYKKRYKKRAYKRPKPKFASSIETNGRKTFIFDPKQKAWAAYDEDGSLVKTGAASGGRGYCPDIRRSCRTPSGSFAVYRKGSSACKSRKYPIGRGGAPMPYCMFFKGGYAIHGSPHVPNYNASHGCVRVRPSAAAWLSKNFMENGTKVIVRPY